MSLRNKYFLLLIFTVITSAAFGQAASSPFSAFGLGLPYGNQLIQNQGMGGIGVSQPQFWSINNVNPALLVFNYNTSFQAGMLVESRTIKSDSIKQKGTYGNLNYLVVAFPVKSGKWTTSAGLMPFTNMNYKMVYSDPVIDNSTGLPIDTAKVLEQGSGGLNQFYWSNGVRIHDDFSVGLKATYIFGSVVKDYSNNITLDPPPPVPFIVAVKEKTFVKDFLFSAGLSFSKDSIGRKQNYRISAGLVYGFSTNLNADKTIFIERRLASGTPAYIDTLQINNGSVTIPSSLTVGISISKGTQWVGAIEFATQDWSKFKSVTTENGDLNKAWKFGIGGEFTPDALARSYFKRVTYRLGASYEQSPVKANNNELKDVGITFGFSCPAGSSSLDWGFKFGTRGDKALNGLEESYYKLYFGISFNDRWFIKRKFD